MTIIFISIFPKAILWVSFMFQYHFYLLNLIFRQTIKQFQVFSDVLQGLYRFSYIRITFIQRMILIALPQNSCCLQNQTHISLPFVTEKNSHLDSFWKFQLFSQLIANLFFFHQSQFNVNLSIYVPFKQLLQYSSIYFSLSYFLNFEDLIQVFPVPQNIQSQQRSTQGFPSVPQTCLSIQSLIIYMNLDQECRFETLQLPTQEFSTRQD